MQPILLAAGRSTRFGADKLLHPLADGTPLALAAARNLAVALPGALAVVNADSAELARLLEAAGLQVSVCPRAHEGMGASLAWGVSQTRASDGWLVALADMPFIAPATVRAVAAAVREPLAIAAPLAGGRRGHPVAFGRGHGPALSKLSGDTGARALLLAHPDSQRLVPCDDPGVLQDIDLPAHLAAQPHGGAGPPF
jgi:molybdenum cofactor cytidylyltransferase